MLQFESPGLDQFIESPHVSVRTEGNRVFLTVSGTLSDLIYGFVFCCLLFGVFYARRRTNAGIAVVLLSFLATGVRQLCFRETIDLSPKRFIVRKKLWGVGPTY